MLNSKPTTDQVSLFWAHGYINNIPVLSEREIKRFRQRFETIETREHEHRGGFWSNKDYRPWENKDHPLRGWFLELATHPRVLDAVECILGPNIMIRNADIFIKDPGKSRGIKWHVDTAQPFSEAKHLLTAWIGLTPSTLDNGCLEWIPGTHRRDIPNGPKDKWNLSLKQDALQHLDVQTAVQNIMKAGCMSIHSFRTVHRSGINRNRERRFGFTVRFMSPETTQKTAEAGTAMLVRGKDRCSHFVLQPEFPVSWKDN